MVLSARMTKIDSGSVLICADMSGYAPVVVGEGLRWAKLESRHAVVLHVVDDRFPYPDLFAVNRPDLDYFQTLRKAALERLREWVSHAGQAPPTEFVVARGKPSSVILELAAERRPSLVVVGAHGLTGSRHPHALGATAERVARSSPSSILIVVRPPE
jgi:nucleotide-binding universal stress UspA family protein